MSTGNATGNGKSAKPPESSMPSLTIDDAFEYLRSALHYLVKAGADIELENQPDCVGIRIGNSYWFSVKPGDIRFALIPVRGVPLGESTPHQNQPEQGTPQSTPQTGSPNLGAHATDTP